MRISTIRHPEYTADSERYSRWRLTYRGGRDFIEEFLEKFSDRENDVAFKERMCLTYPPSFAKAAINKLKNTLYSRMGEIKRIGGPASYLEAVQGKGGGVDLYGSSMDTFIGQEVLAELMTMKRVGIFVDRPSFDGNILARNMRKNPYCYYYAAEDIYTWDYCYLDGEYVYTNVVLRDTNYDYDTKTGVVKGIRERFRHMWLGEDEKVHIQFYVKNDDPNADQDSLDGDEIVLNLPRLPFVMGGLQESLLMDAAEYQIAMLNLASADMTYTYKANFPYYVTPYDPASETIYTRGAQPPSAVQRANPDIVADTLLGTGAVAQQASPTNVQRVGPQVGVRYPKGMNPPEFIAPPTEPLIASMAKQQRMKEEIFELIDIAASQAQPLHASAESKQMDNQGAESGLAYIGLELQYMEREIAKIWGLYESKPPATVNYPKKYMLKSDSQRLEEATSLNEIKVAIPSKLGAKEVAKQIAEVILVDKVPMEVLDSVKKEIDSAEFISSDPEMISIASELGMVDAVTGSNALGFNGQKVVPIAQKEHTERLKEINEAQAANNAARGVKDGAPIQGRKSAAKREKARRQKNPDKNPIGDRGTRG